MNIVMFFRGFVRLFPGVRAVTAVVVALLWLEPDLWVQAASAGTAPPLPPPTGTVVNVSTQTQLQNAVASAAPGTTIVIAPGTYTLTSTLYLDVNDITLRGATGNRNDVVLVGQGMTNANYGPVRYGIWTNSQRTTIANLTIRDVYDHHIILNPGAEAPRIYNVRLVDAGGKFIKANPDGSGGGVDDAQVEYSVFEYSTVAPDDNNGAIDASTAGGWTISNNLFRNFRTDRRRLSEPAILVRDGSRDTLVEGNTFIDCEREVALGFEERTPDDHTGGIVRNNFIYRTSELTAGSAIYVADSPDTQVVHNTILVNGTYEFPIEYRFQDTTGVVIRNNLLEGAIRSRDDATGTVTDNYTSAAPALFVDPGAGDLHLLPTAAAVIDRVTALTASDWDGDERPQGTAADYGADELRSATPPPDEPPSVAFTESDAQLLSAAAESASIGFDAASSSPNPTNVNSVSWSHTTAGSNRLLVVGAVARDSNAADRPVVSVTYEGLSLTRIRQDNETVTGVYASLWYLVNPPTGAHTVRITYTGPVTEAFGTASSWTGVDQASPVAAQAGYTQSAGGTATHSIATTAANAWIVDVQYAGADASVSPTSGQTVRINKAVAISRTNDRVVMTSLGPIASPTTKSLSYSYSESSQVALSIAALRPASTSGAPPPPGNLPPSVSLTSPSPGASYTAPAEISIAASASDSDGTVAGVAFYAGSTLIGSDTTNAYGMTWSKVPAGSYALTAVAVDNQGATRVSAAVSITVSASGPPPAGRLIFTASTNHSTLVTSYTMELFRSGSTTTLRSQNLGKPTPVNGDITVDLASIVQGLGAGTYYLTVTAVGPGGSTESAPSPTFSR